MEARWRRHVDRAGAHRVSTVAEPPGGNRSGSRLVYSTPPLPGRGPRTCGGGVPRSCEPQCPQNPQDDTSGGWPIGNAHHVVAGSASVTGLRDPEGSRVAGDVGPRGKGFVLACSEME